VEHVNLAQIQTVIHVAVLLQEIALAAKELISFKMELAFKPVQEVYLLMLVTVFQRALLDIGLIIGQ